MSKEKVLSVSFDSNQNQRVLVPSDFDHRLPSAQDGFGFGDSPFERRENTQRTFKVLFLLVGNEISKRKT